MLFIFPTANGYFFVIFTPNFFDSWAMNIDRGLINAVVFLDLKKAFDTVHHEILFLWDTSVQL